MERAEADDDGSRGHDDDAPEWVEEDGGGGGREDQEAEGEHAGARGRPQAPPGSVHARAVGGQHAAYELSLLVRRPCVGAVRCYVPFLIARSDPSLDAVIDVEDEVSDVGGDAAYAVVSFPRLTLAMVDIVALARSFSEVDAFGVVPWVEADPVGARWPTFKLYDVPGAVAQAAAALLERTATTTTLRLYAHSDGFATQPRCDLGPLRAVTRLLTVRAQHAFNAAVLRPDLDARFGAIWRYVAPDGTDFWPCQVRDPIERDALFPNHHFIRYDVKEELIRNGALRRYNVLTHHGRYYEPEIDLQAFGRNPGVLVKLGPMGVGKTVSMWRAVASLVAARGNVSVLAFTSRVSQGEDMVQVARKRGVPLVSYEEKERRDLLGERFVLCSIQSLPWKLGDEWLDRQRGRRLIVVVDEVQDTLTALAAESTVHRRGKSAELVCRAVKEAATAVAMSADTRAWAVQELLSWRPPDKRLLVVVDIKLKQGDAHQSKALVPIKSGADWTAAVRDALASRLIVTTSCLSRAKAEELKRVAQGLRLAELTLTRYSNDGDWGVLQTQDDLRKVSLLTYTPTVGAGVSFETEGHFHLSALWASPKMPVDAHVQSVGRVRWVGDPSGERVLLAHLPVRGGGGAMQRAQNTTQAAVADEWRAMAEAEARRNGVPVSERHPVLQGLKLKVESQSRVDRAAFVPRMFDETRRAGYDPTTNFPLRRVTTVEEASTTASCESDRVEQAVRDVDAMYEMEAPEPEPGTLFAQLRERRRLKSPLTGLEKQYVEMVEWLRRLGYAALSQITRDSALALWGVPTLAELVYQVRRFEEVRPRPAATSAAPRGMSSYARDAALRDLLRVLGLGGLHDSAGYDARAALTPQNREVVAQLAADYKDKFEEELVREEKVCAKEGRRKPLARAFVGVPEPCPARVAVGFANVLLSDMGLALTFGAEPGAGQAGRKRARVAPRLRVSPDSLAFTYAVLSRAPYGVSGEARERAQKYVDRHPLGEAPGEARLKAGLEKRCKRRTELREKMELTFQHLLTGEGYRRWSAPEPQRAHLLLEDDVVDHGEGEPLVGELRVVARRAVVPLELD